MSAITKERKKKKPGHFQPWFQTEKANTPTPKKKKKKRFLSQPAVHDRGPVRRGGRIICTKGKREGRDLDAWAPKKGPVSQKKKKGRSLRQKKKGTRNPVG